MNKEAKISKYAGLSQPQLVELLEKRDRSRKLGLVWERDDITPDQAIDADFVACSLEISLCEAASPWKNLIIESDNFDALRWLRMGFSGRVKCIYIDPPYNTGKKDWIYNDSYFDPSDRYRHSTWLEFLYRRLLIARDLLTADGAILVSINDENRARLELLMDEALPGMRVGSMVWRSRTGGNEGGTAFLSDNHEHVLVYGRPGFRFAGTEKTFDMYSNPDNDPEGDWRKSDMTVGVAYTDKRAGKAYYPLHDPETGTWYPCNPDAVWRYASRERSGTKGRIKTKYMEDWITEKRIIFPENPRVVVWNTKEDLLAAIRTGDVPTSGRAPLLRENLPDLDFWIGRKVGFGTPAFKRYKKHLKNPTQPLSSWITPRSETGTVEAGSNTIVSGTNDEGAKAVKDIFGTKAFNYAKPPSLIREMIRQTSSPGDIVLDFFAGSATTAQAVLELNAEDEGDRRFIMVSSTEATAEEPDKNVCRDICAMRVRRLNASRSDKQIGLVAGFAYLRARKMSFHDIDYDISPPETWAILETIHDLPLTPYDDASPWNEHAGETVTLVYIDRVTDEVIARLHALAEASRSTFVYTWAPGQIVGLADGEDVNILPVHDTLVQRFQQ